MVKVERSQPAPESLAIEKQKKSGNYKLKDVVERLQKDFNDKCYICELKGLQDPEVEHLLPHHNGRYIDRKFDWNNLFWVCGHCNNLKNHPKYEGKIIDCCNEDPETVINFFISGNAVAVQAKNDENEKAVMTAELCDSAFNMGSTPLRDKKCELRVEKLQMEMCALFDVFNELRENPESRLAKRKLKGLLNRNSQFAAFKRNYVRTNYDEQSEYMQYLK